MAAAAPGSRGGRAASVGARAAAWGNFTARPSPALVQGRALSHKAAAVHGGVLLLLVSGRRRATEALLRGMCVWFCESKRVRVTGGTADQSRKTARRVLVGLRRLGSNDVIMHLLSCRDNAGAQRSTD